MAELLSSLKTQSYIRKSEPQLIRIRKAELEIIDDMMVMVMETNEANLFFQLVSYLYEKSFIILTSIKGQDNWSKMLGDQVIATAIFNRLLYRCEVIHMDGKSNRIKNREIVFD